MNSLEDDARLKALLARLHAENESQLPDVLAFVRGGGISSIQGAESEIQAGRWFWRDKLAALDRAKAEFCYLMCRALVAKRAVEAGTSFGVSTLYLAAALRDNGGGSVVGTEYEPEKARAATAIWEQAGLSAYIDLREGDLRQTLRGLSGPIDFLLIDVWAPMALPALELVAPHMRSGGVVIADYTADTRGEYDGYFAYLRDPANGFSTVTLPFEGGLTMSVKTP